MDAGEVFDKWLEGTIHRETQVCADGVHLTVDEISRIHTRGRLDFGGSELKEAATHPIELTEHMPGERYAWWRLNEGDYLVRFNERIKEGASPMLLVSNQRLLRCGCRLGSTIVGEGDISSVLSVPEAGIHIKENARIAVLRPMS